MRTVYYPEKGNKNQVFFSKESCEQYEKQEEEREKRWLEHMETNSPFAKLEKLKRDLEMASTIPSGTIATCSYDCLAIKGMVKVCQTFAEDNKKYLSYY